MYVKRFNLSTAIIRVFFRDVLLRCFLRFPLPTCTEPFFGLVVEWFFVPTSTGQVSCCVSASDFYDSTVPVGTCIAGQGRVWLLLFASCCAYLFWRLIVNWCWDCVFKRQEVIKGKAILSCWGLLIQTARCGSKQWKVIHGMVHWNGRAWLKWQEVIQVSWLGLVCVLWC